MARAPSLSIPFSTRRQGAITTIPLGVRSIACQMWKQLEPTTSNEDIETDDESFVHAMFVHVRNWKTVIACMQHVIAFPRGDDCRPCIVNVCTARVCIADHVLFTDKSTAYGRGSDPCQREGWAPSHTEAGCILTSAVRTKGPHP